MTKAKAKIPRPANSFLQFHGEQFQLIKDDNGDGWRPRMAFPSKEDKAIYITKALKAKEEHKRAYPNYQYHPQKKSKKTTNVKTEDLDSPSFSTSPSSSVTTSSASTPAPTTPDAAMLIDGSSSFSDHDAFDFGFGEDFLLNHHTPYGIHATEQLPRIAQSDGHSWSSQLVQWTDQFLLPSASTSMQSDIFSLSFKGEEMWEGLFRTQHYRPQPSYTPQQSFPPLAAGLQLPAGIMNQQIFTQVITPPQAHTSAAPFQPQTELPFEGMPNAELEAWNKEFAPLNAGFCNFLSAWDNINASATATATASVTPASASPLPTAVYNLKVDGYRPKALPFQTQGPSLPSPPAGCIDPHFRFAPDASAVQALPSTVWPGRLNL